MTLTIEAMQKYAEDQMILGLESKRCACGKRERAAPQHILHSDFSIDPPQDPPRHDIFHCTYDCIAKCGVCGQIHEGHAELAISEDMLK